MAEINSLRRLGAVDMRGSAMAVMALGYIVMGVSSVPRWRDYMANVMGTHVEDFPDGTLVARVDSRAWRMAFEPSSDDDILAAGWEVDGAAGLKATIEKVRAAGHDIVEDSALAGKRGVKGLARTTDPSGVACEFFWGATERFEQPLILSVGGGGFITGEQGLGHIVLSTTAPDAMLAFYRDMLGFRISDFIDDPRGGHITKVTFFHCNGRHHSLAFAEVPAPKKLLHFMLEREDFDDVGLALDRLSKRGVPLSLSLGRHVNDHMVSFYAWTPSGVEVEYGWGARSVDDEIWSVVRHDSISIWGHETINPPGSPGSRWES